MTEPTDTNLVQAARQGEAEAFGALVRRYQSRVHAVALGILADFDLALDAAQDAFLCAYCELPRLRDPERFGAWLCGIARNTALVVRREQHRDRTLAARTAALVGAPAPAPSALEVALGDEVRRTVQQALSRVNDRDREALTLCYAQGLSHAQMCAFLGISPGALKGRLQRGRAALRKELAMVEQVCRDNAPDEDFARGLEAATRVFAAPGPATHHLPSAWHRALLDQIDRVVQAGDLGLRLGAALAHAGSARQRFHAAACLGLRRDPASLDLLQRLLDDRAPRVRRQALKGYARRIHPGRSVHGPPGIGPPALREPPGLDPLLARAQDDSFNVRLTAVQALAAYRDCGEPRVTAVLQGALGDPKHKVRHAAARALRVPCPGCRRTW